MPVPSIARPKNPAASGRAGGPAVKPPDESKPWKLSGMYPVHSVNHVPGCRDRDPLPVDLPLSRGGVPSQPTEMCDYPAPARIPVLREAHAAEPAPVIRRREADGPQSEAGRSFLTSASEGRTEAPSTYLKSTMTGLPSLIASLPT